MLTKDSITGREIDLPGLMEVVRSTERRPAERFDMEHWVVTYGCGTAACMVGSFCEDHKTDALLMIRDEPVIVSNKTVHDGFKAVQIRFGLSDRESAFLFHEKVHSETPEHAAARVRKFIFYKYRKAKIFADYEKARRTGDVGVIQSIDPSEVESECVEAIA